MFAGLENAFFLDVSQGTGGGDDVARCIEQRDRTQFAGFHEFFEG